MAKPQTFNLSESGFESLGGYMKKIIREKAVSHKGIQVSSDDKGNVVIKVDAVDQVYQELSLSEEQALTLVDSFNSIISWGDD